MIISEILRSDHPIAVFDPQTKWVIIMTDEYEEKSGCKLKAVAATWLSTRRFLPQRKILDAFRWSQEAQSHGGKQGLLEKDDFTLNHLKQGRWSQEWGHCKVETTPLIGVK